MICVGQHRLLTKSHVDRSITHLHTTTVTTVQCIRNVCTLCRLDMSLLILQNKMTHQCLQIHNRIFL